MTVRDTVDAMEAAMGEAVLAPDALAFLGRVAGVAPGLAPADATVSLRDAAARMDSLAGEVAARFEERQTLLQRAQAQLETMLATLGAAERSEEDADLLDDKATDVTTARCEAVMERMAQINGEIEMRKRQVAEECVRLNAVWEELGVAPDADSFFQLSVGQCDVTQIGVSDAALEELRQLGVSLMARKVECEAHIRGLGEQIIRLWDRLKISEGVRQAFFEKQKGLGPDVVRACEIELARLRRKKQESITMLVREARVVLEDLWEKLYFSEAEREAFAGLMEASSSEETLNELESTIDSLEARYESLQRVLKLIERREEIREEQVAFESAASGKDRLMTKRRDPGRLLREEKFRKVVEKDLPRLENALLKGLAAYKKANGRDFTFYGTPYAAVMKRQAAERAAKREEARQARVAAREEKARKEAELREQGVRPSARPARRPATGTVSKRPTRALGGRSTNGTRTAGPTAGRAVAAKTKAAAARTAERKRRAYGTVNDIQKMSLEGGKAPVLKSRGRVAF